MPIVFTVERCEGCPGDCPVVKFHDWLWKHRRQLSRELVYQELLGYTPRPQHLSFFRDGEFIEVNCLASLCPGLIMIANL